ncbi:hypothetical protein FF1_018003 [Malus domestica]|uniref:GATA domain class transcription factor n=2 Tax=Malus TaxID=3749 RepID=D9ZIZ2_MALDO|nr:transcription factor GATA-5 [Malus domestica]ADL36695.1 GATA domain class transcription factor [Malus domestica]TQD87598.1 hypothetical protein C1H46_026797 [Malus baccata]
MAPPPYHNLSPPSPFTLELSGDHHGDHDLQYHHLFNLEPQASFSSSSSLSSALFLTPAQVQGRSDDHYREPHQFQFQLLEADHNIVPHGGSHDHDHQAIENEGGSGTVLKLSISKNGAVGNGNPGTDHETSTSSVKWMSSKMRMMRKMSNPDQTSSSSTSSDDKPISMKLSSHKFEEQKLQHPSSQLGADMISCSNNSSNNMNNVPIIRVCSDCNTTKTPLWRSGPRGPKSLCNACGIRQRKARRAMAAAAAAASGTTLTVAAPSMKSSKVQPKANKSRVSSTVPFKKRPYNKLSSSPSSRGKSKKLCFEDFTISMKNNSSSGNPTAATTTTALQRVFPQDEKEAAILLMALSCGLVHG